MTRSKRFVSHTQLARLQGLQFLTMLVCVLTCLCVRVCECMEAQSIHMQTFCRRRRRRCLPSKLADLFEAYPIRSSQASDVFSIQRTEQRIIIIKSSDSCKALRGPHRNVYWTCCTLLSSTSSLLSRRFVFVLVSLHSHTHAITHSSTYREREREMLVLESVSAHTWHKRETKWNRETNRDGVIPRISRTLENAH